MAINARDIYKRNLRCCYCNNYKPQYDIGGVFERCECKHASRVWGWRDGKPVMVAEKWQYACSSFIPKQYEFEFIEEEIA